MRALSATTLAIMEKTLRADHPDVAICLNNLGQLYCAQGKYDQAEVLYKRSLAIMANTLGADHPNVAACLNNLAQQAVAGDHSQRHDGEQWPDRRTFPCPAAPEA